MAKKKKPSIVGKAVGGVALGAVLAAGAATYFFTQTKQGKNAAKDIKKQAVQLSKDISTRLHKAKDKTQATYNDIVEQVVDEFEAQKKVGTKTVKALKRDLKQHWKAVQAELRKR